MRIIKIVLLLAGLCLFFVQVVDGQVSEVRYNDWPYSCTFKTDSGKFIINSREDFLKIAKCGIGNYDYNDYTLIGVAGATGGCSQPTVVFTITRNDNTRSYFIEATILTYGACRRNNIFSRTIYTYKLREDYKVIFSIHNKPVPDY